MVREQIEVPVRDWKEIEAKRQREADQRADKSWFVWCLVFVIPVSMVAGSFIGAAVGREDIRKEAVRIGQATWEPDENGAPVFKWIDNGGQ